MLKPVARIGDTAAGTCLAHSTPRAWTAVFTVATGEITEDGREAVTTEDINNTSCGHHFRIRFGSSIFTGNGKKIGRMGDECIVIEGGTGVVTSGSSLLTSE